MNGERRSKELMHSVYFDDDNDDDDNDNDDDDND